MPILSLRRYNHTPIAHQHMHTQLVFGLDGLLEFEMDGRSSLITRHFLAVIPAHTEHGCQSNSGSDCLVLDLPADGPLSTATRLQHPATLNLVPEQQQLVDWLARCPLNNPRLVKHGAALLLASLEAGWHNTSLRLPLALLDRQIDKHLAHPLQVADLAQWTGLSPARLHARFMQEQQQTPMDYVRHRRLDKALQFLRKSQLPIGEIAERCGYQSPSAFSAAFARQYGCSPRELRANTEQNSDK